MNVEDQGYNKLMIYKKAHKLAVKVHKMTFSLPKFEMFEEGYQIRKSAKSISNNIVEGYALRKYKKEFLHFLYRAYALSEETIEHLRLLYETKSLLDNNTYNELINSYSELNTMLFSFIETIEQRYKIPYFITETNVLSNKAGVLIGKDSKLKTIN